MLKGLKKLNVIQNIKCFVAVNISQQGFYKYHSSTFNTCAELSRSIQLSTFNPRPSTPSC